MIDDDKLPLELVWEPVNDPAAENPENLALDGGGRHLSEIVRTAIADGQVSIVPKVAFTHLQSCETCVCAIGEAAMLSARISAHLNELAPITSNHAAALEAAPVAQTIRLPWAAIAAALAVAALAALPSVTSAPVWFAESSRVMTRAIPHLMHGAVTALGRGAGVSLIISYASAALLMLVGVTVAMRQNPASPVKAAGR